MNIQIYFFIMDQYEKVEKEIEHPLYEPSWYKAMAIGKVLSFHVW